MIYFNESFKEDYKGGEKIHKSRINKEGFFLFICIMFYLYAYILWKIPSVTLVIFFFK